jgi:drug/metabolite transporter (DMT)-like permease
LNLNFNIVNTRTKAYLALLTTSLIWGFAPPIIKYSLGFVSPVEFLTLRFLIVSVLISPLFLFKLIKNPFELKDAALLILTSLCGTSLTLGLLFWGLSKTSAIDSAVIAATCPLMIVGAGAIFLKEIITKQEKLGLFLAFLGTMIAVASPLINGNKLFTSANAWGNFLIFISNISWAAYSILSKKTAKKYPTFNITALSFFVGLITFVPLYLLEKKELITCLAGRPANYFLLIPEFPALLGILYMSLLGSIIGYFTYTYGFSLIEASEATLFSYLQPIFAAPLAVLWLGEKVTPVFLIGAVFIALGVFLTEYKRKSII